MKKLISLVIPCYNEEVVLPDFYKEVLKTMNTMKEVSYEMVFIDDGSIDKTLNIIKKYAKENKRVRYISFSRNFGKEAAIYSGLDYANGDYVAVMDADLQDPPEYINKMYQILEKDDYDVVALVAKNNKDYNFIRRFFTKLWYLIIGKISSIKQTPGIRDFRLMRREVVEAILKMKEYNRYSKGLFSFVGFNTKLIEYEIPKRYKGNSKFSFRKLVSYSVDGITSFSSKPLKLSVYLGLLFCLLSIITIMVIIVKTLVYGDPVAGWPSLACIIIFVSGVQLFFLGVIGTYISKIYLEVKERPLYIIKETDKK